MGCDVTARIRIVSSGAAGAERGALEAAIDLGLDYDGWRPEPAGQFIDGRMVDDRPPDIFSTRLRPTSGNPGMARRLNVQDSDGTLGKIAGLLEQLIDSPQAAAGENGVRP